MTKEQLFENIQKKRSFLSVGLDTDIHKIPKHFLLENDPVYAFNRAIIDATEKYAVAYKINTAFYEALGPGGWESIEKTLAYIPEDIFTIADAKRGDIGNTSKMYADAFFGRFDFDSLTVAPYMGKDSVSPFLDYKGKWVILLALTSNEGAFDFQQLMSDGKPLYASVLEKSKEWGDENNLMYVIGATRAEMIADVRKIVPNSFLLVPGVGSQGGDLERVCANGMNGRCGLLVNSSRGIIFAGTGDDFAVAAEYAARELQLHMGQMLDKYL